MERGETGEVSTGHSAEDPGDDLRIAKAALRERMRNVRAAIAPGERAERAARVERHLFELPALRAARTVMLFSSFGSEIPTESMAARVVRRGARLLLPYLDEGRLEATEYRHGHELVRSAYGAMEPARRAPVDPLQVEVVVTPGLAFDRWGHRLGYGGGYYDGFLRRLPPSAVRVGVGFAEQVVPRVPADEDDERVHLVVTEDGVIACEWDGPPETPPYT